MIVRVVKPHHATLRKFIRHFYFLSSTDPTFRQSYVTFPRLTTPLSLLAHSRTRVGPARRRVVCRHAPTAPPHAELDGIFSRPMLIDYRGPVDEVTVVFEPLGLNPFLPCDFSDATGLPDQEFNPYGSAFVRMLDRLFSIRGREQRRRLLEDFFLEHYRPFDHPDLFRSFEALTDADSQMPVSEIARSLGVCHKTLTRLYQRHLGTTPVVLRRIARFRRSIELTQNRPGAGQFTQIAYLANYYDQPHLIREFQELTGESPACFFRHVSAMDTGDILWRIL